MSDAEDSEFDKEAERERLREKYERDQEDRAAAQQMSDLLLKGATMTNSHCGQCGSPIFRADDQEFCPSCSAEAAEAADAAEESGGEESAADDAPDADGDPSPDERLRDVVSGDEGGDDAQAGTGGTSIAERAAASVQSSQRGDSPSQSGPGSGDGSPEETAGTPASGSGSPSAPSAPQAAGNASLADAQQSLLNAITRHARAAAEADPRTARDHLEAANEAAEALAEISPEN